MDIDLLSKMVKELILDNDRVVLPGLGSFVAEIVPSTFTDRGYTITPPYRRLYFRSKPDEGEMLVRFYAETNNVEPEMAERIIRDFVSELKSVLHVKKTVVFPGLGRLRATKENNVFFVADEDLDIYPAGFGLEPISLKTHEETPQEVAAAVEVLKEIIEEPVQEPIQEMAQEPIDIELVEELVPADWNVGDEGSVTEQAEAPLEMLEEPAPESVEETVAEEEAEPAVETVVAEPAEEPANEPEAEPAEEITVEPVAEVVSVPVAEVVAEPEPNTMKKVLKVLGIVVACLVFLLVVYVAVMRLFPDFMNDVLYTPEELEIINFR